MAIKLDEYNLERYMYGCIELAKEKDISIGKPDVGAVVVSSDGEILGEGYKKFIDFTSMLLHAERVALDAAGDATRGSYLFTTLEPCIRVTRQQVMKSCCELIVERGIDTVVVGLLDVSPWVHPESGIHYLRQNGIDVIRYDGLNHIIMNVLMGKGYRALSAANR